MEKTEKWTKAVFICLVVLLVIIGMIQATKGNAEKAAGKAPLIRSIAYLTDCNYISDQSIQLIHKAVAASEGGQLTHLVIDGLRIKEHSTHFNFLQALEASAKIGGEHIWFTHLTHNSSHEETISYLAEHRAEFPGLEKAKTILPAYDGLTLSTVVE